MTLTPIEIARGAFAQSAIATMASQLAAYFRLVRHPDVQFSDLLEALSRGPVIADDAAMRLHTRLQVPAGRTPEVRRVFWEEAMRERKIEAATRFYEVAPVPTPVIAQPVPSAESAAGPGSAGPIKDEGNSSAAPAASPDPATPTQS